MPRYLRVGVHGRLDHNGNEIEPLSQDDILTAIDLFKKEQVEAVSICFMNAFANPEHERAAAELVSKELPGAYLTVSTDLLPSIRFYERISTTALNSYVGPILSHYLGQLKTRLKEIGFGGILMIMQSNGGVMSPEIAEKKPAQTLLSGPAGGPGAGLIYAQAHDQNKCLTIDMGGTSFEASMAVDSPIMVNEGNIDRHRIALPMLGIHTIGAGGGSVGWIDKGGLLRIGPESAGADPGPACYQRGGTEPTVTDANLLLGRLGSHGLLGGSMKLDVSRAASAFDPISDSLGISPQRAAQGVIEIVVANMVRAIRTISVERGHDPRSYCLMPFGGAGPLHARDVAHSLGIREILVPPAPGIICAHGLVVSDLLEDFVDSVRLEVNDDGMAEIGDRLDALVARARAWYEQENLMPQTRTMQIRLDMRYVGQNFELAVPLDTPDASGPSVDLEELRSRFFDVHEKTYGYFNPDDPIEIMNFRLTASGRLFPLAEDPSLQASVSPPVPSRSRQVVFDGDVAVDCPVFERKGLLAGQHVTGTAVIDQLDATTVLFPGDRAEVNGTGTLLINIGEKIP